MNESNQYSHLKGKKLLIIGGAFQHCKLVESARKMGITTYVTDFLPVEKAPGKQIADHYWMYNITELDEMAEACRREGIDGAIQTSLDACQRPYQQLCEMMGFPCFGTKEQFFMLTDKNAFKKLCTENGVDVIPEYKKADFEDPDICKERVQFPVFIKPCDSRGSRGQSVCYTYEEALKGIEFASSESSNGDVVIEKYMGTENDFSVSYIVIDGEPYLIRSGNRFLGAEEDGLSRLCIAGAAPTKYTDMYLKNVHANVCRMIKNAGIKNAPVFMQGFADGDTVRFYDPGLRFPGIEYERMYERACGINPIDALVEFAVTGKISDEYLAVKGTEELNGKIAVDLLVALKPGKIAEISGIDEIKSRPDVVSAFVKMEEGEIVEPCHNVNQRLCEIDIVTDSVEKMQETINWIYSTLKVTDEQGNDMVTSKFDVKFLEEVK